jgi:hypothetical protein
MADPAVRRRIGEATRKRMADPAVRRRIGEAIRKGMADPAVRRRMSSGRAAAWERERKLEPGLREAIGALRRVKGVITKHGRKKR